MNDFDYRRFYWRVVAFVAIGGLGVVLRIFATDDSKLETIGQALFLVGLSGIWYCNGVIRERHRQLRSKILD